jgi:Protein of unknown function (DUF3108)
MRRLFATAALLLAAGPLSAAEATLGYDAYVKGSKVGEAEIRVERDRASYAVSGNAWTIGALNFFTRWQSMFRATGRLDESRPVTDQYSLIERARNKVKEMFLSDGHLTYVKNGETRSPEAPTSVDWLSALFVNPDCAAAGSEVHNGKDRFAVKLLTIASEGAVERCEFELRDDDDERINATVLLGEVNGLTVPLELELIGALEGTLKLRS